MGMTNRNTIEKTLNNGELSEYVMALHVLAKATGQTFQQVHAAMSTQNGKVSGTVGTYTFTGDGKMLPPFKEISHYIAGNTTDNVKNVIAKCAAVVNSITLPAFDTINAFGGTGHGKDDLTFLNAGQRTEGWSLKWEHDAQERSQGPSWDSVNALYSRWVNIDHLKTAYETAHASFTQPARRYSAQRGDWSPELIARGLEMQNAVEALHDAIGALFVAHKIDPVRVAQGMLATCTGASSDIVFILVSNGTVNRYDQAGIAHLAEKIRTGTFTYEKETTETGKTRDANILLNGEPFLSFRTTASADKAPGQSNGNLRRIKRQTYVTAHI